jgi:predicted ATPase/transcriptional regulator with XRE-family HTH domain
MGESSFGDLLRRFRVTAELSRAELAARAGLSVRAIGTLERGERRAPRRGTIDRLSLALGLGGDDRAALNVAARAGRTLRPVGVAPPPPPVLAEAGLIGREVALAEVVTLVRHAGARLLTITGPGGVGKTRLAAAVSRSLAADFPDGTASVSLADLRDPGRVVVQIGRALGLSDRDLDPAAAVLGYLRDRVTLLLLDNFEHLLPAAPLVADLLAACPRLVVLATSRAPLRLAQERVYDLSPLSCPEPGRAVTPALLCDYGAPALFAARGRESRPGFALTATNAPTVAAICARLDGLPLAIELAAARLNVLAPAELLARLSDRLPLLTRGRRDLPDRQRTLGAALAWSYGLLNAGEQALFRRLALFSGGATQPAIEAVCATPPVLADDLRRWLAGLVEHRLVHREVADAAAPPRFTMLETVREYAAARLAEQGEEADGRQRHAAHFLALAEEAMPHLSGVEQDRWLAALVADHDNLRAAVRRAIEGGDAPTAIRLGAMLWRFWYRTDHWTEGRAWLRETLAVPGGEGDALLRARAQVERGAGGLALLQADLADARDHLQSALALSRRAGDVAEAAKALDLLGVVERERGDMHAAVRLLEEALTMLRAAGAPRDVAATLNNLALVYQSLHDPRRAADAYAEVRAICRDTGDRHVEMVALSNLGNCLRWLGDYAQARALSEELLARARQLDNRHYIGLALYDLGAMALDKGEAAEAARLLREAIEVERALGSRAKLVTACASLGNALRLLGDHAGAVGALSAGAEAADSPDLGSRMSYLILVRGSLAEDDGDRAGAREEYRLALDSYRRYDDSVGIGAALVRLGAVIDDPAEAAACFRESLGRFAAMHYPRGGVSALEGMAAALLDEGLADRAARLLGTAVAIRARLGAPREPTWAAFCARTEDAVRAALGDAAFDTAHGEGRQLDFAAAAALAGVAE